MEMAHQVLKNKKILLIGALIVIAAIIFSTVYFSRGAYAVKLDDEVIGVVKKTEEVDKLIEDIMGQAKLTLGKEAKIPQIISYDKVYVSSKELTPIEAIKNSLEDKIALETEAYAITVDGNDLILLKDEQSAEEILDRLLNRYETKNEDGAVSQMSLMESSEDMETTELNFKENVEIQKVDTRITQLMDEEEAYEYIVTGTDEVKKYTVKKGETASHISMKFDISLKDIEKANPDVIVDRLQIGQELNLTVPKPFINVEGVETITYEEKIPYQVEYESTSSMYKGDSKVKVTGKEGKKEITAELVKVNGILEEENILEESIIKEPQTKIVLKGSKERPKTMAYGVFYSPGGSYITSRFGPRWGRQHRGIDIGMRTGTSVKASDGGKVTYSGWKGSYGYLVIINHENGYQTYYGHNSKLLVKKGDRVYRGQVIAKSGATGNVTGPHLHFEILKNGQPVNPSKYVHY